MRHVGLRGGRLVAGASGGVLARACETMQNDAGRKAAGIESGRCRSLRTLAKIDRMSLFETRGDRQ